MSVCKAVWPGAVSLNGLCRGGGGYRGGGYSYYGSPFRTFINLSDLFFYWDPYYSRRQKLRARESEGPNFFEAIFSFGVSTRSLLRVCFCIAYARVKMPSRACQGLEEVSLECLCSSPNTKTKAMPVQCLATAIPM